MRNILTYLKLKGSQTLNEYPFNSIDSLILCQLAYMEFDNYIPSINEDMPAINVRFLDEPTIIKKSTINTFNKKCNRTLLSLLFNSERFKDMDINWIDTISDDEVVEQFAAMTFVFKDFVFVAMRGTDMSLLGWKEDFFLAVDDEIPSHKDAVKYLEKIASKTNLPLYVGGHSKGGNLAVYASYKVDSSIKDRIISIYNHDGPGFKNSFYNEEEFSKIKSKIHNTVPHNTMIGILLNHMEADMVIKSKNIGILQHDPFNWELDNNFNFKTVKKSSFHSTILEKTVMDFINLYSREEAIRLIDLMFEAASNDNTTSVMQIMTHPYRYFLGLGKHLMKMNKEDKKLFNKVINQIVKLYTYNLKEVFRPKKYNIDINMMRLQTKSLLIRRISKKDSNAYLEYDRSFDSVEKAKSYIESLRKNKTLVAIDKETKNIIGVIDILDTSIKNQHPKEFIFKFAGNNSLNAEIMKKLINYVEKKTDVNPIIVEIYRPDLGIILEELGFIMDTDSKYYLYKK